MSELCSNTRKKRSRSQLKWDAENYLLMIPYFVFFFAFTLLPVLVAVFYGFTDFNMLQRPHFVGWDNFVRMFSEDEVFLISLKNTLIFALVTGPVSYLLCFVLAWLINELGPAKRTVLTALFYAPALSGQAFTVFLFFFSNDEYGIVNGFLMRLGFIQEPVAWLGDASYVMTVLIIVQLWMSLGTGFLAFIAGLQGLDSALFDAAAIDGIRNRLQELWYVTLPQMLPSLTFGAVMQIVSSFTVADISIRLLGFPSVEYAGETIVTHIMDLGNTRFEMGYSCAIACILFLLMVVANKTVGKLLSKVGS